MTIRSAGHADSETSRIAPFSSRAVWIRWTTSLAHVSKPRTRKVKPWTAEEARQFLESARQDQDPLYAAYVLILVMGLRKGEMVGSPWSAVNLDGG